MLRPIAFLNIKNDSVGEGEGGKIWENGIETCKISCMKWVASPKKKKNDWIVKFFKYSWEERGNTNMCTTFINNNKKW